MTRRRLMSLVVTAAVVVSTLGLSVVAGERRARHHAPPSRVQPAFVDAYQPDLPAASEIDTPGPVETPAVTH